MKYEIYADQLFVLHWAMNFLLLYLAAALDGRRAGIRRLALSAAGGSLFFLLVFLSPLGSGGWVRPLKTALQAAGTLEMLRFAFRLHSREGLIRSAALYIAAACLPGGILGALHGVSQGRHMTEILFPASAAAAAGVWLMRRERKKRENPFWTVTLREGEKSRTVTALMDSGNSLCDPVSQKPVCIVSQEVMEQLGLFDKQEKFRLIPYHSIGKTHGLMQAAAVEEMYLYREGQERSLKQVMLAVSAQPLSSKGRYQMLLHPALLEERKGENHDIESSDAGKDAV